MTRKVAVNRSLQRAWLLGLACTCLSCASTRISDELEQQALPNGWYVLAVSKLSTVITNYGSDDGCAVGDELEIVRHGRTVGRARVEQVFSDMASAVLLDGEYRSEDIVRPAREATPP